MSISGASTLAVSPMDFPLDPVSSLAIGVPVVAENVRAEVEAGCSHVGSVKPDLSVMGMVEAVTGVADEEVDEKAESTKCTVNMDPTAPEWKSRVWADSAPPDRTTCPACT